MAVVTKPPVVPFRSPDNEPIESVLAETPPEKVEVELVPETVRKP